MSERKPHFVLAGGGTGGHLYPGLAVAHALRARSPEAVITFFTTERALDRQILVREGFGQVTQPVQPLTMKPWRWPAFIANWRRSVAQARKYILTNKIRAVLGLGGYAAGPPVVVARRLGIRRAILNPDAVPGKANQFLARRTGQVFQQWEVPAECRWPDVTYQTVGCPIRSAFAEASREAGRRLFELDADRPVLLVTGASQGARTVNRAVQKVWPGFAKAHPEWQLLHLTGSADEDEVRQAYEAAGVSARVVAFTHEMADALAAADVVVSRAGASTLAELTALGKPAILLPYPYHRDRHQHANGQVLVDGGAAIMLEDRLEPELNAEPLRAALERLVDQERRAAMADASRQLGHLDAADQVAAWLLGDVG